jgi:alpha-L-fucosidase
MLIRHVSRGGNLLLNAGPTSRGCFDEYETEIFQALSRWMKWNGRSITGCTVAPAEFPEPDHCLYTYNEKTNRLYLHLFSWPDHRVILPKLSGKVKFARLLETGCELMLTEYDPTNVYRTRLQEGDLLVKLPIESPKTEVPVIELFLK